MLWLPKISGSNKTYIVILLTKTTAAQNGVALSYRKVRGLYFLAFVFVTSIVLTEMFGHSRRTVHTHITSARGSESIRYNMKV